jgi:DNA-binding CsgD family transcriptional regulator
LSEAELFVDRQAELATLRAELAEASTGRPRFVLVEGENGIGKSALLRRFAADTDGAHVLSASGDESETLLEYGVVEHLCRSAKAALPGELVAITDRSSVLPEPFSVGKGLLELLSTLHQHAPVVVVVDNAHLADASSQLALLFAFRRLQDCRVLAVLAATDEAGTSLRAGLCRLVDSDAGARVRLRGLGVLEIGELGTRLSGRPLSRRVVERLRDHTGGNPLHVRALVEELSAASLGGSLEALWPAPRSFSLVVSDRLASCSPEARRLVVAAAVAGMRCPFDIVRRLSGVQRPLQALQEAIDAYLVEYREREISFGHPLVRAAVYHDLGVSERVELHAGAAMLVGDEAEVLRHRAAAATKEDDALAADLAAFAAREATRGSWASAAAMFVKAASLVPVGPHREPIVLDAVECLLKGGDVLGARALADPLETFTDAARSRYLLGQLAILSGRSGEAEPLLTAAWERCPENDRMLAAKIACELLILTLSCLRAEEAVILGERALAAAEGTPFAYRALTYLIIAMGWTGRAAEAMDAVAAVPQPGEEASAELAGFLLARTLARIYSGAIGEAHEDASRLVTTACRSGDLFLHVIGLAELSLTEYRIGAWNDAIVHAELGASLAEDAELLLLLPSVHASATWPLAGRGEWDSAEGHAKAAADRASSPCTMAVAKMAEAVVAGARGQHQRVIDAVTCLRGLGAAVDEPNGKLPWHELYVGALIGMDRLDDADAELERFEAAAAAPHNPLAMSKASRLRGNLEMARGRNEEAGAAFDRALEHSSRVPAPFDRALAQASCGTWLRREGKLPAAVEQLETAREGFVRLGARPFLESCDRELASCRPLPSRRRPVDPSALTPKEVSVATLVTQGKTNREVAAELAISVNTVEYHLKHIYAKLGITSRSQLIVRLGVGQEGLDGEPR